jgi:hypothetical protein
MSGDRHRRKDHCIERGIGERHVALGVQATRYLPSRASHFSGSGHDVDSYLFGREEAPIASWFTTFEPWLGERDALVLGRNNTDPLVVLLRRVLARILVENVSG